MLVLTRRVGDDLTIGDDIHVTVLAIHGNKVRLGISPPDRGGVRRGEVVDRSAAPGARPQHAANAP